MRGSAAPATALLVCTTRDRPRQLLTRAFPRGRAQLHLVRDADGITAALRTMLVDAIIVDLLPGTAALTGWRSIEQAVLHAPIPTVAMLAPRALDATLVDRLHTAGVGTVLIDGVDDAMLRGLLHPVLLTTRFVQRADVLLAAHDLGATADAVWRTGVSHAGALRSVAAVARQLGMSREHLARLLNASGAPTPRQLLELVRLLVVQTQLHAGVPVALAAARLGYSSVSHLARVARAASGVTPRHWHTLSAEALIAGAIARGRPEPVEGRALASGDPSAA